MKKRFTEAQIAGEAYRLSRRPHFLGPAEFEAQYYAHAAVA